MKKSFPMLGTALVTALLTYSALHFPVRPPFAAAQGANPVPTPSAAGGASSAGAAEEETQAQVECAQEIASYIESIQPAYGEWITTHFQSEYPTSVLIEDATERYRIYRRDILTEFRRFFPDEGVELGTEFGDPSRCAVVVEDELRVAREVLKSHIIHNAQAKQTTALLDSYKALNSRLEKLHFDTAQLYGYFKLFADKLPCYAQKCVKGG